MPDDYKNTEGMRLRRRLLLFTLTSLSIALLWYGFDSSRSLSFWTPKAMQSWREVAAAKREGELAKIPKEWRLDHATIEEAAKLRAIAGPFIESLLDDETLRITRLDPLELTECTGNGSLSAYSVVKAFCKRAAYGHQLSHNLLEVGFDVALGRARDLDEYYSEHGRTVGPLQGLPITLKDHWHVKGMETCFAYVGWIGTFEGRKGTGKERVFESELIKELVSRGAVVIGKSPETNNNIVGYQLNPWNQLLSAGGSSGGEGAVQGLRGSAMGFGSDSGGSVGMPAAYNGVYSIKPSSGRMSFKDAPASGKANPAISGVVGILGPSVASLRLMFKSLLSTEPWLRDPYVHPIPYRAELEYNPERDPLPTFGIMRDDGLVRPHPPIARAMNMVEAALRAAGHGTLAWNPPSHGETIDIHGPIARGDGCPDAYAQIQLSGEAIVPQISALFPDGKIKPPMPLIEWEDKVLYMQDYRTRYQDYWTSTAKDSGNGRPVDAFIVPISPTAAVIPGKFYHSPYSSFVNVLDYSSIVIQVTVTNKSIDTEPSNYKALNEKDKMNMDAYDADVYDGAPAAVQIIGKRLEEENLLSLAQVVVDALAQYKSGGASKV
ncbi:hypothetical protein LTR12_016807 [Friedmanniomyces endolithicus]|nr:hypothetical protein LTR12_016807 [Friedmanniomyces endolithicus]